MIGFRGQTRAFEKAAENKPGFLSGDIPAAIDVYILRTKTEALWVLHSKNNPATFSYYKR
jgi:hypothetical protein